MEPTGIQLGFKNMELSFCVSRERVQMQFRYRRRNCMTYGRWWRRKRRWGGGGVRGMRTVPFTEEWDPLYCVSEIHGGESKKKESKESGATTLLRYSH